jgi:MFS family permease
VRRASGAPTIAGVPEPVPSPGPRVHEPLRRNRDFRVVLVSQGISALGDAVSFTALPLLVFALSGSGLVMGVVAAVQALADFAFALPAGSYADRHDRKRMMVGADLGRAILTGLIPLSVLLGGPTLPVVILVAGPLAVLRAVALAFVPARALRSASAARLAAGPMPGPDVVLAA